MVTLLLGMLLVQIEPEAIRRWVGELQSEHVETRDAAARKLIDAGESARSALTELVESSDLEARSRAREILGRLDDGRRIRGQKVLVSFIAYPVGSKELGSDNTEAHEKVARDIQDALAKARVKVVHVLRDSRRSDLSLQNPKKGGIHYAPPGVSMRPLRWWKSPRTGVAYPVSMQVNDLRLEPLMDDQELDARASVGTIYWEGAVRAFRDREEVGRGYLELTGYWRPMKL